MMPGALPRREQPFHPSYDEPLNGYGPYEQRPQRYQPRDMEDPVYDLARRDNRFKPDDKTRESIRYWPRLLWISQRNRSLKPPFKKLAKSLKE